MKTLREAYDEVYAYSMGRPDFILQHVVDAWAAQNADEKTKPIGIVFALVGLYLRVERQFSGSDVQRAHMRMGREKRVWPAIALPRERGDKTPFDVLKAPAGPDRDRAIDEWCASVWAAFDGNRQTLLDLLREYQL